MTHEDPWPDPVEAKRLEKEREEQLPDPLPGFGLGTGRLGDHGLGAGRLKNSGLGDSHHATEHSHSQHSHSPGAPGMHHRNDDAWHPPAKAQLVAPVTMPGAKAPAPAKIPPPLFSGPIEDPVKINRRQVFAALGAVGVLGVLIMLALRMGPGKGGQFEQLGQKLGEGPSRSYKYVADGSRQLYWPNDTKYVNAIPEADRLYIHDDNDLASFTNYKAGQL